MVLALALAGCDSGAPAQPGPPAPTASGAATPNGALPSASPRPVAPPEIPPVADLAAVGTPVVVSVDGHRTSEFMAAHDPMRPDRIVAAGMDWDGPSQTVQCAAFASADGGATWTRTPVLPGLPTQKEQTDPWVTFDPAGTAYVSCAVGGTGLYLSRSHDGGMTWAEGQLVPTGGFPIKGALGAFGHGELLVCYQQGGPLHVLRSTDDGAKWTDVSPGNVPAGCNGIQRSPPGPGAPAGTTYVLWQGGGQLEADNLNPAPPSFGILRSTDGGVSWTSQLLESELGTAPANMQGAPQAAAPSMAVSNLTGTVVLAAQRYQNAEVAGGVGTTSQALGLLKRSTDGGMTFTDLRMPEAGTTECAAAEGAPGAVCNQVHPTLAFDARGRLILQFSLSDAQSLHKETWMTVSSDEGSTWLRPLRLAVTEANQSFVAPGNFVPDPQTVVEDPAAVPGSAGGRVTDLTWPVFHRDGGEYFGITTNGAGEAVDLWVQHDGNGRNQILAQRVALT